MTDYEKICDFQNLYQAHLRARLGKRHKSEVIKFEMDLANNLAIMQQRLINKTYVMRGYYDFVIYEPKRRDIFAASYPDRVLLHCLCDTVLMPLLQKRVIHDNAACQVGKGTHFAIKRLSRFMHRHYQQHGATGYFLKCDITKYFANIDHQVLKDRLTKAVADKDARALLFHFIDSYETAGLSGKGLPLGNQSSQCFAIYYLDPLDRFIKEVLRIKHYVRYMDDLILLHRDKKFLQVCLVQIRDFAQRKLKLTLNEKTQIFPLRNGTEFLGWRFYLGKTGKIIRRLKTQSKLRYKRRLRKLHKDHVSGTIALKDLTSSLASYKGHLIHGHAYKLKAHAMRSLHDTRASRVCYGDV
ncbi:MAG: RNA-directed DNA polymerase [Coriobacteriales bacterium]|jgi:hypothetical protein|nr:RNA-directed DNA polymerase [Coriobacteriales bacterium]